MKKNIYFYVFIWLLVVVLQTGCKTVEKKFNLEIVKEHVILNDISLTFSGDIMAHDVNFNMKDYSKIYDDVRDILLNDDLSFGNVEMPVCDELPLSTYPRFNVHSSYLHAAALNGFDVFSFANNHTNDKMEKGIEGTHKSFSSVKADIFKETNRNIFYSGIKQKKGEDFKPVFIEKNGFKILFLSITEILNSHDGSKDLVYYSEPSLKGRNILIEKIRTMREKNPCDIFILSLHLYEAEYGLKVSIQKKKWFNRLAEAGIDVIWAHHPHVLQTWETFDVENKISEDNSHFYDNTYNKNIETQKSYRKVFVMYSMGNFISGQRVKLNYKEPDHYREYTGDSALMQLKFKKINGIMVNSIEITPFLITAYKSKDGIVIKKFTDEWIQSLPEKEKIYYLKRLQFMKNYLPLE